ncbi:MAG TPA: hypothetical protein VFW47_14575 [Phenylobacterium sp.]|nr:hypothetical protein [Phenylobacterium sp.]
MTGPAPLTPAAMVGAFCVLLLAAPARCDPCEAVPAGGETPAFLQPGATFSGPVVHVGDGDSLCVAVGSGRSNWVEVRLSGFYAPELSEPGGAAARAALQRAAMGRTANCRAEDRSYDRIVAACDVGGRDIGDLLRASGAEEGGRAYRPRLAQAAETPDFSVAPPPSYAAPAEPEAAVEPAPQPSRKSRTPHARKAAPQVAPASALPVQVAAPVPPSPRPAHWWDALFAQADRIPVSILTLAFASLGVVLIMLLRPPPKENPLKRR